MEAGQENSSALAELCQLYWQPVFAFARRSGANPEDAEDLTQEFFARLIDKKWLVHADPVRGRFRNWLLASMKHFLTNEWHRARTQKRGGGAVPEDIDSCGEIADPSVTPDAAYDVEWAETLLANTLSRLRSGWTHERLTFDDVRGWLPGGGAEGGFDLVVQRTGMAEGAVKSAVQRLRGKFRETFRAEVVQTLSDPTDADDEIRHLGAALAGRMS